MDIQPRPIAETVSAPRPNLRLFMSPPLAGILLHGHGAGARYNSAVRRIEAVVFDIGGVVQESPLHAIARYERDHGLLPDAVNPAVAAAGHPRAWAPPRRGALAVARRVPRRPRHEPQTGARAGDGHDQGGRPGPGAPRAFGAPRGRPLATPATMRAMTKVTKSLAVGFAGVDATVSAEIKPIPFRTELSLAPLVAFWARTFGDDTSLKGTFARTIREATEAAPELLAPITDPSVIDRHRQLVDMLMAAVFPAAVLDREYGAAITPFQLRGFYATPPFEQLFLADDGTFHGRMNIEPSTLNAMRLLRAYSLVLARVYSIELDLDYSFIFTVADPETGLDRHFKAQFDLRFVDVVPVGPTPPLTEENRRRLHGNLLDRDFLLKILPTE